MTLTTSAPVIAEVVFILSSKRLYNLSRQDVRIRLYPILSLQGLRLAHKQQYLRALDLYNNHPIDFEDALSVAFMERNDNQEVNAPPRKSHIFRSGREIQLESATRACFARCDTRYRRLGRRHAIFVLKLLSRQA